MKKPRIPKPPALPPVAAPDPVPHRLASGPSAASLSALIAMLSRRAAWVDRHLRKRAVAYGGLAAYALMAYWPVIRFDIHHERMAKVCSDARFVDGMARQWACTDTERCGQFAVTQSAAFQLGSGYLLENCEMTRPTPPHGAVAREIKAWYQRNKDRPLGVPDVAYASFETEQQTEQGNAP